MATYTQSLREMAVTVAGADNLLFLDGFEGSEGLSQLFHFDVRLMALSTKVVDYNALLGAPITLRIGHVDESPRYINGIISGFRQGGPVSGAKTAEVFIRYRAEMVPKMWLMTRNARSRIFEQKSVPDILRAVLAEYGLNVAYKISGTFEPREYCVQYRETDFAFVSRLMEEEKIYYFFAHTASAHQLVLANTPDGHAEIPGGATVRFEQLRGGKTIVDRITRWEKSQEIRTPKSKLRDHCSEASAPVTDVSQPVTASVAAGAMTHSLQANGTGSLALDDYPGGYAKRFDGITQGGGEQAGNVGKIPPDGARTVKLRMEEEAAEGLYVLGEASSRRLVSGHKFTLSEHFSGNGTYVLTHVSHQGSIGSTYMVDAPEEPGYRATFRCLPVALPYRPPRVTPRARVEGAQTAFVVGPAGAEIFTDKYGRVQVQFHWDRAQTASCWVRVGTPWAGTQWGAIHIPRIGQEVIVQFLEGDPDRPIIVGSVYNAANMPPYTLPDNMTQSGIKSRSTTHGSAENFNELRFEDKKGSEEIYFHAEKDFNRVVENNDTLKVGFDKKDQGDQTVEIFNNQTTKIGTPQASDGSQTIEIYKDRTATLKTGNETLDIKQGNREVKIEMGNDTLTISMGNQTTKLNLGASTTEAMQSIELKVGANSIKVDQTGITLKGIMVTVEGQAMTQVKAPMTQVNGDGMLMLKGGITMIN